MTGSWSYNNFSTMMDHADIDDHINALEIFLKYLESIDQRDSKTIDENKKIIDKIMYSLQEQIETYSLELRVSFSLRVLVSLSIKVPIENLKHLIESIIGEAFNQYCAIKSHFATIMKEILALTIKKDVTRQKALVAVMFPMCINRLNIKQKEDNSIPIDLTAALIESFGSLLTKENYDLIYEKIISLLKELNPIDFKNLGDLAKAWIACVSPENVQKLISALIENVEKYPAAFTVLTTLILSTPGIFGKQINNLVNILFPRIDSLLDMQEEEEEVSPQQINDAQNSIMSFESLINAFPDSFKDTADVYCQLVFDFCSYGVFVQLINEDETTDNNMDDELDQSDLEEIDDEDALFNDETWKVRKAVHILAQTLIHKYPETFIDIMNKSPENSSNTCAFITETDSGVKSLSLHTLNLLVKTLKSKINQETINNWNTVFVQELRKEKQNSLAILYPLFGQFLIDIGSLPSKLLPKIIQIIDNTDTSGIANETLTLINSIIRTSSKEDIDKASPSLCKILTKLMKQSNSSQDFFNTISTLYYKATNASIKSLSDLNSLVIKSFAQIESKIYAINSFGVFIALYDKSNTTEQSLNKIIECINIPEFSKSALSAILLIATSPSYNSLKAKSTNILSQLQKFLASQDKLLLLQSLWIIDISLQNKIYDDKQCDSIAPTIAKHLEANDINIKLVVAKILRKLSSLPSVTSSLINLIPTLLSSQKLDISIISIISEIIIKNNDNIILPLVDNLIKSGNKISENITSIGDNSNISSIASFIGFISTKPSIFDNIIQKFEDGIKGSKINQFSLFCLGEIGLRVSTFTKRSETINKIFELVSSSERHIFMTAVNSIGLIATNSLDQIFPKLIEKASSATDDSNLIKWIIAISKTLKQLKKLSSNVSSMLNLEKLFQLLHSHADFNKETSSVFTDCFSLILSYSPALLPQYISAISKYDNSSPVISRSIAETINFLTSSKEAESMLKSMLPHLNPNNPSTSTGAILTLKNCFKFEELYPLLLNNCKSICKCIKFNDNMYVEVHYGVETKKIDMGRDMRLSAIDTLLLYLSKLPSALDYDLIIRNVTKALNDPLDDVKISAISFLIMACDINEALRMILKIVLSSLTITDDQPKELKKLLIQLIAKLHVYTQGTKIASIEKLVAKVEKEPQFNEFEESAHFSFLNLQGTKNKIYSKSKSVSYKLISQYNKEAASLFYQ